MPKLTKRQKLRLLLEQERGRWVDNKTLAFRVGLSRQELAMLLRQVEGVEREQRWDRRRSYRVYRLTTTPSI